ncbi:MAG: energy transducer TonB [Ignavibacteria bacterium GWA2_55_25]|nr:MAG: energy transducer TonB [Ignavibacteria bacterium GWA2_55_25]
MVRKNPEVDLRLKYNKTFEIGLIISLALMIVAFKFFPDLQGPKVIMKASQELVDVEDIDVTKQENRPPPPPKPLIPIEAPSDEALDDVTIQSTEVDITKEVAPPPPKQEEDEETYFIAVEDLPEPIGGIGAIQSLVVYPEIARRAGVEGTVYVEAFVDESGAVTRTEIKKGIGAGCDEAAASAVMKAKFKPGKQRGKAVKVRMSIPVRFRLQK